MPTKRKIVVPGAESDAPTPTPRSRKTTTAAAAAVDPNAPAPAAALPPKIVEAEENATHMSVEKAAELDSRGELTQRVLTPQGWYVPKAAEVVG